MGRERKSRRNRGASGRALRVRVWVGRVLTASVALLPRRLLVVTVQACDRHHVEADDRVGLGTVVAEAAHEELVAAGRAQPALAPIVFAASLVHPRWCLAGSCRPCARLAGRDARGVQFGGEHVCVGRRRL